MLLYSDDGPKSSWVCDCFPTYVYFPQYEICQPSYLRGNLCPLNHYAYLPIDESLPKCVKNLCYVDGMVPFKNNCYPLYTKDGPCPGGVLGINETTFQLQCLNTTIVPFVIIDAPKRACPKGSRRNSLGICRTVL